MRSRCFAIGPLVVLALALTAFAEEIRGVIRQVDPDRGDVVLEGRGRAGRGLVINFDVDKETHILFGREPGAVSDLQPGQRVRLVYEVRDGRRVALGMTVHGAKKPATPVANAAVNDANTVSGSLIRVAQTDREIVVISPAQGGGAEKETTLAVPEKTPITRDGKTIKLEDLKEGERVVVKTDKQDGKLMAASIQVGVAGEAAPRDPGTRAQRIERVRAVLKIADWVLQQIGNSGPNP